MSFLLLGTASGRSSSRNTILNTIRVLNIIERQNPIGRVIASIVHIMDRHAPTNATAVLQQRIRQPPDGSQIQSRTRGHLLGENANAALVDIAIQCKRCTERSFGPLSTGRDADSDRLAFRDADDMVAIRERCGIFVCGVPEGVAETLGDAFGAGIVPACERTQAGAAAIDSKRSGEAEKGTEAGEGCDGARGAHG